MLGLPGRRPDREEPQEETGPSEMLGLVEHSVPKLSPSGQASIEAARDRTLTLLDQQIAPAPRSWRDHLILIGALASILLHVALVLLVPQGQRLAAILGVAERRPPQEEIPPVYLLPYLPREKAEPPARRRAPLSDLDRRAHGGEGAPAEIPGMHGNTLEPRLEPPGQGQGAVVGQAQQQGGAPVPPSASSDDQQSAGAEPTPGLGDKGEGAVLHVPKSGSQEGAPTLKGLSSVGGSLGGSGAVPDRRGGRVDMGPLSFDTEWYDWGPYAREMLARIRAQWVIPEIAQWGVPGVVRIRFFIERSGRVTGLTIEAVSGHPSMDFAARDAILNASPLPPLPPDLTGVDREGVTITFYYNMKPPERGFTDN